MPSPVLLKFGGSTLLGPHDLVRAVYAIDAEVRTGRPVIAVTSAFQGRTDELEAKLRGLEADRGRTASAATRARLLATGETETVQLLVAALGRAGLSAIALDVADVGPFVAPGTEWPTRFDADALLAHFASHDVVCLPGFAAVSDDAHRTPALLGRGGSDMTAVFVGHATGAEVRLVKDVEGLYSADPSRAGAQSPARLAAIDHAGALALGPSVLQTRAVQFAERVGLAFDVVGPGHVGGSDGTRVGAPERIQRNAPPPRPARVAFLGLGDVGARVFNELAAMPTTFEAVRVLLTPRDEADRVPHAARLLLTASAEDALDGVDLVLVQQPLTAAGAAAVADAERKGVRIVAALGGDSDGHWPAVTRVVGDALSAARALVGRRGGPQDPVR